MTNQEDYILTGPEALHLLELVVKEHGEDYVYVGLPHSEVCGDEDCGDHYDGEEATCLYMHGERPGCIVGHLFHDYIGVDVPAEMENVPVGQMVRNDPRNMPGCSPFQVPGVVITPEAHHVLAHAQGVQDGGNTWGEALAAAEEVA
jgi:hypothetical protein